MLMTNQEKKTNVKKISEHLSVNIKMKYLQLLKFARKHIEKIQKLKITNTFVDSAATNLRSCAQKQNDLSKCKNQKTKDAFVGLVDAILAPCSNINEV